MTESDLAHDSSSRLRSWMILSLEWKILRIVKLNKLFWKTLFCWKKYIEHSFINFKTIKGLKCGNVQGSFHYSYNHPILSVLHDTTIKQSVLFLIFGFFANFNILKFYLKIRQAEWHLLSVLNFFSPSLGTNKLECLSLASNFRGTVTMSITTLSITTFSIMTP